MSINEERMDYVADFFGEKDDVYKGSGVDIARAEYDSALPIESIDPWRNNRALDETNVEELRGSLKETKGQLLQPVLVRPKGRGRYELLAGHHRIEAIKRLNAGGMSVTTVRALVLDLNDDAAKRAVVDTNIGLMASRSSAQRGAFYLSDEVEDLISQCIKEDPDKYASMRRNDVLVEILRERGLDTSVSTIKRDKAAARTKQEPNIAEDGYDFDLRDDLVPEGLMLLDAGKVEPKRAKAISHLPEQQQHRIFKAFKAMKKSPLTDDEWLAAAAKAQRNTQYKKLQEKYTLAIQEADEAKAKAKAYLQLLDAVRDNSVS